MLAFPRVCVPGDNLLSYTIRISGRFKMKRALIGLICLLGVISFLTDLPALAEEGEAKLEEIVVTGERIVTPTKQTSESVYTGKEVTRKGIEIEGSKANTSVYNAIDVLPGISVESVDPFGLAAEQRSIRVRGVRGFLGSMSVEGVPNWGGNPIGPREYIYDTENFQGIAFYKGGVPGDLGTGIGSRGGAIELRPRWPEEHFGADLTMGLGSYQYYRSFLRVDSGALPTTGTRASASYSYTFAEKWKGPGDLGPRNNANFMLQQPAWGKDNIKIWFNYNDVEQDLYRALTFAETQNFNKYYRKDYNSYLTKKKSEDIYYYKNNHADLKNMDMLAIVPVTLNEDFQLSFKPYISTEDSQILGGSTAQGGIVSQRLREIERYGLLSEASANFSSVKATLGYLFETNDMKINTKNYDPVTMAYKGWGNYGENEDNGMLHSPYFKLAGKLWNFDWQAGVKYFYYGDPASRGFVWNSKTNSLDRAPDMDRGAREYADFFPSVGISYKLMDNLEFYTSYGKDFIRPYSYQPLVTLYNQNIALFRQKGVTLADMFEGYNMELTDTFDLGARFKKDWFEINPTVYYSTHRNLLTTVYDPRVKLSYQQNIGEGTGYGVEVETNIHITDNITFFVNPTYSILTYDDNLTYQGYTLNSKGKQVVDTPEWLVKSGLIFKYSGLEIVPMFRYVGERYGDAEHKENIGDYFLADLKIGYTMKNISIIESMKLSMELQNIFNTKYVSLINASDDSRAGSTSYYVGAPFTVVMKVSMEF